MAEVSRWLSREGCHCIKWVQNESTETCFMKWEDAFIGFRRTGEYFYRFLKEVDTGFLLLLKYKYNIWNGVPTLNLRISSFTK